MAVRHYKRLTLTSAESSLEALAISKVNGPLTQYYDLQHGDTARVDFSMDDPTYPGTSMDFIFDSTGTDVNSAPSVIRPIDYDTAGPGVWRLIKSRVVHLTADTLELTDASQGVVMSPAERTKLSGVEDNANLYVHPADHDDMYYNETEMDGFLAGKEPVFSKNTAFNKNFGSAADTVCQGDDSRLSDARTPVAHDHDASAITSGTIDIARLPQGALERLVHVADQAAMYALTTTEVQNGDTVQQDDTGEMFRVIDDTNLNNAAGYTVFTAGVASSAPWTGITGKPATYPADPHDHGDIYYTETEMNGFLAGKEDAFTKNTAFNKDFGTAADTVCQGDDTRLADDRFPTAHDLAGAEHNAATLAELNLKISDATLIDTTDERLVNDRTPLSHGNEKHDAVFITATEAPVQTVAGKSGNVELVPSDAGAEPEFTKNTAFNKNFGSATGTVCEGDDARLSDDRYPTAHESSHITGGADEIPGAVASVSSGLLSAADKAKLDGIEAGAVASIAWGDIVNQPENQQLYNNLIDASDWAEGTTGTQGIFTAVGGTAANSIVMGLGPDGAIVDLWKCTPQDATTEDGGWSDSRITIDNTKTYRFVTFVQRTTAAEGTIDFGIVDNAGSDTDIEVYTAGGSTLVPAPDFKSAFDPPTLDKWYMLVGYVFGTAYAGAQQNLGGVYDCATGAKIASCTDYQWGPTANQTGSKVLYNNSTDSSTALAYFYGPRIDMVSGMEPSLKALIPNPVAVNAESLGGALPSAYATLAGTQTFSGVNTFTNDVSIIDVTEATLQIRSTKNSAAWTTDENIGLIVFYGEDSSAVGPGIKGAIKCRNTTIGGGRGDLVFSTCNGITNDIEQLRLSGQGDLHPEITDTKSLGLSTNRWLDGYFSSAVYIAGNTAYHTGNDSNLAKLDGTQTFSGVNTFSENVNVLDIDLFAGTNWTSRTSASDNGWLSIAYGNGLFVAVANSGAGNRVMTSPDGINWVSRTSAADNGWRSIAYGNGLFVAVSYTGTGNRVMTSPDGINWTSRTSASDNDWYSIAYGNGLFVAVADSGTGNRVMTSPDGINWTSRTSAADNGWRSVTYGNGLFVAVSNSGTGNRVMTSPDGTNWTSRTSASDNDWLSIAYGNGLFVAVSYTGTGNRVMTSGKTIVHEERNPNHTHTHVGGQEIYTTGNDSNLAKLDGTQTFSGTNTLANTYIAQGAKLYAYDSVGAPYQTITMGANLNIGDPGVQTYIRSSATPEFVLGASTYTAYHTGNDSNLAKLNGTQTFTGANTFNSTLTLNYFLDMPNNTAIRMKTSTGTLRASVFITTSDVLTVGSTFLPTDIRSNGTLTHNTTDTIYTTGNDSTLAKINATSGALQLPTLASDPASGASNGQMYYNTTSHVIRAYINGSWVDK